MRPWRRAPGRRKYPWRACIPWAGQPIPAAPPAVFASSGTTRNHVGLSFCSLLATVRKFSAESGQEPIALRVSQRHHQAVQDIRWHGEHLRRDALSRCIEVDDRHFKAGDATGLLPDQQCLLAVGALVGNVDLQVHYTALPALIVRVTLPFG